MTDKCPYCNDEVSDLDGDTGTFKCKGCGVTLDIDEVN